MKLAQNIQEKEWEAVQMENLLYRIIQKTAEQKQTVTTGSDRRNWAVLLAVQHRQCAVGCTAPSMCSGQSANEVGSNCETITMGRIRSTQGTQSPGVTSCTTNPIYIGLRMDPGFCGGGWTQSEPWHGLGRSNKKCLSHGTDNSMLGRPNTNCLSHGTAKSRLEMLKLKGWNAYRTAGCEILEFCKETCKLCSAG